MIVANRATLSGIIRTPFLFLSPASSGVSGGFHNNIRLGLSPIQLGFGRTRYAHTRVVQDKRTLRATERTRSLKRFNFARSSTQAVLENRQPGSRRMTQGEPADAAGA